MTIEKNTTEKNTTSKTKSTLIIWGIAILTLMPWIVVQAQTMVVGNVAGLLMGAERLLHGMSLSEGVFESNPPLSILIYIPPVLIARFIDIPLPVGATIFTFMMIALSTLTTQKIIAPISTLTANEKRALIFGYLVGITAVSTTVSFADREHLMIMALFPFILCQYLITEKIQIKKWLLYAVMFFGTIAVLVKPHYGLLPTLFILHRMLRQKRFNIFLDPDFLFLSIGTLAYIASVFLWFSDYIPVILPDALDLYVVNKNIPLSLRMFQPHLIAYVALFIVEILMEDLEKNKKRLLIFFYTCALLALTPSFVQMKGFYNHLVPAFAFFVTALSLSLFLRAEKYIGQWKILPYLTPIVILGLSQLVIPLSKDFPKHSDVPHMAAARFFEKECSKPCIFFVFHHDMEIMNPTAAYMDYTYASRFPTYWFIPHLAGQIDDLKKGEPTNLSKERLLALRKKYSLLSALDLEHYKPSVLLIGTNIKAYNNEDFDFIGFFSQNKTYKDVFENNYEKTGTLDIDRADYFQGTNLNQTFILKYDIYKRKKTPWISPSFLEHKKP